MENAEKKERKGRGCLTALVVMLLVLFVLIGVPLVYLSCFGFSYDDGEALADAAPMPASERFAFHADTQTVDIAADPSDVWWLLLRTDWVGSPLAAAEEALAPLGLSLDKAGLSFVDGQMRVTAKLRFKGVIPLPLRADVRLSLEDGVATAALERIWLGRGISMETGELCQRLNLDEEQFVFTLRTEDIHSRLKDLTGLRVEEGRAVFTCKLGDELVSEILGNYDVVTTASDYLGDFEAVAVAKSVQNGDRAAYDALLQSLEADPAHYVEFRRSELAIAEDFAAKSYLSKAENALLARFLPEVNIETVGELSAVYEAERASRETQLRSIVKKLEQEYAAERIVFAGDCFTDASGQKVTLQTLAGADWAAASQWLSEEESRVLFGHGGNYYQVEPLKPLRNMPVASRDLLSGMQGGDVYCLLLLTRLSNGRAVLAYYTNGSKLTFTDLDEETFAAYLAAERTPVYELGLEGTYDLG